MLKNFLENVLQNMKIIFRTLSLKFEVSFYACKICFVFRREISPSFFNSRHVEIETWTWVE